MPPPTPKSLLQTARFFSNPKSAKPERRRQRQHQKRGNLGHMLVHSLQVDQRGHHDKAAAYAHQANQHTGAQPDQDDVDCVHKRRVRDKPSHIFPQFSRTRNTRFISLND